MKTKILNLIFAMFILLPCIFTITACGPIPPSVPTNAELAVIYKNVADKLW